MATLTVQADELLVGDQILSGLGAGVGTTTVTARRWVTRAGEAYVALDTTTAGRRYLDADDALTVERPAAPGGDEPAYDSALDAGVAAVLANGATQTRGRLGPLVAADPAVRVALEARVPRAGATTGQAPLLQADGSLAFGTVSAGVSDAGASTKGLVQLAGDLGGTAAAPTVPGLALKAPYRAGLFTPPQQQITVVSTCDSGWTHLDTGAAVHDSTIFDAGTASLKITAPSTAGADKSTARLTFAAQDWSASAFAFRFRTDDWANIIDGYLLVSTSGSFAQFYRVQITPKMARVVNGEWSEITLTRGDFDFNSGTADWATVNGVMFQLYSADGTAPSLWIDQFIRYATPAKATISFAFDDGFASTILNAKPALDKWAFRGSAYVMPSALGTSAYMTQAQVDVLAAQGWDIGGHGVNDLTTLSAAAAEADVQATKAYLVDRGYKGGDVYAYPLGGTTFALRAMVAKYFNAARGTSTFGQTRGYVVRRNMMTRQLGSAITVPIVQGWVDQAVAGKEWLIITGHKLTASPVAAEDFSPTNFATVVDYVAASGAQVLPVSEALAQVG